LLEEKKVREAERKAQARARRFKEEAKRRIS